MGVRGFTLPLCPAGLGGFSSANLCREPTVCRMSCMPDAGIQGGIGSTKPANLCSTRGGRSMGHGSGRGERGPHPSAYWHCVLRQVIYLDGSVLICKMCVTLKPASQDSLEGSTDVL